MFNVGACVNNFSDETFKVLAYSWVDFVDSVPVPERPELFDWIIVSCGMPI